MKVIISWICDCLLVKNSTSSLTIVTDDLTKEEVDLSVCQLKNGKAPDIEGLPPKLWKLFKLMNTQFCIETFMETVQRCWVSLVYKYRNQRIAEYFYFTFILSNSCQDLLYCMKSSWFCGRLKKTAELKCREK